MAKLSLTTRMCLAIALSFVLGAVALSAETPSLSPVPDKATVRQTHLELAQQKLEALQHWRQYEQQAWRDGRECTQTNYDVTFYDIQMLTDDQTNTTDGRIRIMAQAAEDDVSEIQIDFIQSSYQAVDSVVAPTGPLAYTWADDIITVQLDHPHATGEPFDLSVYYQRYGQWSETQGVMNLTTFSEPWSARNWWPCKDRPDDKADSFKIAVTIDDIYYCGSNGTLDSIVDHSGRWQTFYYTEHYPMVTYLFSLAIVDYTVWYDEWVYNDDLDTMPIVNAVWPGFENDSYTSWAIVPEALTILSDMYGQYPFADEKYGHANHWGGGAMEHQTMSTMGTSDRIWEAWVVVHELAHQWCGDMITCRSWPHLWLNEGWASYSEALYFERRYGYQAYLDYMTSMEYFGSNSVYSHDTLTNLFSMAQYDKGAWVLHQLRRLIGDSTFFAATTAYYNSSYQHGTITTDEFKDLFEGVAGMDLDWFFDQWVYGFYYPVYQWSYWHEPSDTGGTDVYLIVDQVQMTDPQLFMGPLDFLFRQTATINDTQTVWIDDRHEVIKLNVPLDDIIFVLLDPENWVLEHNYEVTWGIRIVTIDDELSPGQQFFAHTDTIESKGGFGQATFSLIGGSLPDGYALDDDGIISGVTSDTGWFAFTARVEEYGLFDEVELNLYVAPTDFICGDVDFNGNGPNVSDLSHLVAFLFEGGPPPPVMDAANVDGVIGSGGPVDVSDLTYLIDYFFTGGPDPQC